MLPFQIFSSFFSSVIWLLVSEVWRECVPAAAAMEGTERAGRRLALSALPGSFRERCWRTLIMASFSIIFAWRFFILPKYKCCAYRDGKQVYTGSNLQPRAAGLVPRYMPCCSVISAFYVTRMRKLPAGLLRDNYAAWNKEDFWLLTPNGLFCKVRWTHLLLWLYQHREQWEQHPDCAVDCYLHWNNTKTQATLPHCRQIQNPSLGRLPQGGVCLSIIWMKILS